MINGNWFFFGNIIRKKVMTNSNLLIWQYFYTYQSISLCQHRLHLGGGAILFLIKQHVELVCQSKISHPYIQQYLVLLKQQTRPWRKLWWDGKSEVVTPAGGGTKCGSLVSMISTSCGRDLLEELVTVPSWEVRATFSNAISCTMVRSADVVATKFESTNAIFCAVHLLLM